MYLLYIGLLYRMGLLLYMGLARVIRAGWAPRNHCWVTGCLTTSLKCGTDHYSVWPTPVMYKYRYMCQAQPTLLSLPNPCQVQVLKYKYQVQPTCMVDKE